MHRAAETVAFEQNALETLNSLKRSLARLLGTLPSPVARPRDLRRILGIDYKLCWQVLQIVQAEDLLSVAPQVPGRVAIRKLLAAARSAGAAEEAAAEVESVATEFARLVATNSGSRNGFDIMLASVADREVSESFVMQHRRGAFRHERYLWGVDVATHFRQLVIRRADEGERTTGCFINAKYGLRRLRQEVMPIVHAHQFANVNASEIEPFAPDAAEAAGALIIPMFCSKPVPKFRTFQGEQDGWVYAALDSEQIGSKASVDLVFGGVARDVDTTPDANGARKIICGATTLFPTALTVLELITHRPSFGVPAVNFEVTISPSHSGLPHRVQAAQQFSVFEKVIHVGMADKAAPATEVPRYAELQREVFKRMGWEPSEFDVFRIKITCPILHTSTALCFDHKII